MIKYPRNIEIKSECCLRSKQILQIYDGIQLCELTAEFKDLALAGSE
jgi:hypothetical protein